MVTYEIEENDDGSYIPTCTTPASSTWMTGFIVATIVIFFVIPMLLLVILYTVIARHLMANPAISRGPANNLLKYRKQVVLMLGTVVLCFFVCLLPFKAFTLFVIIVPKIVVSLGIEGYFSILYFSRLMLYLNSAINPMLYNMISVKHREGFLKLCGLGSTRRRKKKSMSERTGTYTTGSTNCSSNSDFWRRHSSNKSCGVKIPYNNHASMDKQIKLPLFTTVMTESIVKQKQESYV